MPKPAPVTPANVLQVFVSSVTSEMASYRDVALRAIRRADMLPKNFNDDAGVEAPHGKTIFDLNRDTVRASDVLVGLYGFAEAWRPSGFGDLSQHHTELREDPGKLILEYEYEWAFEAGLYVFPFLRTPRTDGLPAVLHDARMAEFHRRLKTRTVGWLTNLSDFDEQLGRRLSSIKPRVFLSYSRKNSDAAQKLQSDLRREDVHVWRDVVNIPGGAEWSSAISAALARMDALLVLVTAESVQSEWVRKECQEFTHRQKPVVPYVVEPGVKNALPEYLRPLQCIDGGETNGFNNLAQRLRLLLAH